MDRSIKKYNNSKNLIQYTKGVISKDILRDLKHHSMDWSEVYSIEHYLIVSDLRQGGGFLRVLWFTPSIKLTATI
jgi:hypothetical protein